jgi:hypothetical protein
MLITACEDADRATGAAGQGPFGADAASSSGDGAAVPTSIGAADAGAGTVDASVNVALPDAGGWDARPLRDAAREPSRYAAAADVTMLAGGGPPPP